MTDRKWFEAHDNLVGLATWLNSECCCLCGAEEVIYFFEKPWKWEREYNLWVLWNAADADFSQRHPGFNISEWRERCIEAVDDEKMTAERLLAELEEEGATDAKIDR